MGETPSDDPWLQQALTGGALQVIGEYRLFFDEERWEWSEAVERLHGYLPGTATPTTELVLSHKHPDDYAHVAATLEEVRRTHKPFGTRHRIITVQGDTREVVVIGERFRDDAGEVIGTRGFYIDVTPTPVQMRARVSEAVAEFTENRVAIEQAKGVLMFVYRIPADAAFELLVWRSQESNVKVRALAEQLMADVLGLQSENDALPTRGVFDQLLLTAHHRVKSGN